MESIDVGSLFDFLEEGIDDLTFEELEAICVAVTLDIQILKEIYYENPSTRRGLC